MQDTLRRQSVHHLGAASDAPVVLDLLVQLRREACGVGDPLLILDEALKLRTSERLSLVKDYLPGCNLPSWVRSKPVRPREQG